MKLFVVEVTYLISLEEIEKIIGEHRQFLKTGYEKGWLLFSGPQEPRKGGIVVARAPSREDIESFFQQDPYRSHHAAEYRITEFNPVLSADFIKPWLSEN